MSEVSPPKGKIRAASLNATAYRIFKTLQWLSETPLSVDELNARFAADPVIGRRLSEDAIWLYLNTLKKLGCDIARPVPANGYRYRLRKHPFGARYDDADLQTFIDAKRLAESALPYPDILALDRLFKKALLFSSTPDIPQAVESVFNLSRSRDYEAQLEAVEALGVALREDRLLFLQYRSPLNGLESFYFLPSDLFYQGGVLYLCGARLDAPRLLMLRVDRVERFETTEQPAIYARLDSLRQRKIRVRAIIFSESGDEAPDLGALEASCRELPPAANGARRWEVAWETRELFLSRQKLLCLGAPFAILEPDEFRASLCETLNAMARLYEDEVPAP